MTELSAIMLAGSADSTSSASGQANASLPLLHSRKGQQGQDGQRHSIYGWYRTPYSGQARHAIPPSNNSTSSAAINAAPTSSEPVTAHPPVALLHSEGAHLANSDSFQTPSPNHRNHPTSVSPDPGVTYNTFELDDEDSSSTETGSSIDSMTGLPEAHLDQVYMGMRANWTEYDAEGRPKRRCLIQQHCKLMNCITNWNKAFHEKHSHLTPTAQQSPALIARDEFQYIMAGEEVCRNWWRTSARWNEQTLSVPSSTHKVHPPRVTNPTPLQCSDNSFARALRVAMQHLPGLLGTVMGTKMTRRAYMQQMTLLNKPLSEQSLTDRIAKIHGVLSDQSLSDYWTRLADGLQDFHACSRCGRLYSTSSFIKTLKQRVKCGRESARPWVHTANSDSFQTLITDWAGSMIRPAKIYA